MRLEQTPKLKQAIETRLDDILVLGFDPTQLKWSIEVDPGDASLKVVIHPEFESMKDPHDPAKPISRDQLKELVQGSTTVSGHDSLEGKLLPVDKVPLLED